MSTGCLFAFLLTGLLFVLSGPVGWFIFTVFAALITPYYLLKDWLNDRNK